MFKHNLLKKKKFNAIEEAKMADELRERNSSFFFKSRVVRVHSKSKKNIFLVKRIRFQN